MASIRGAVQCAAFFPVRSACLKYFRCDPFVLQAGVKTGLKVRYRNTHEVGADRIAGAVAAAQRRPATGVMVVDCGTATTFDVIMAEADYLGGATLPGVGICVETLAGRAAKLTTVKITRPAAALGRSTAESIQAGVYHGHAGAIRQLLGGPTREAFAGQQPHVIGTGGFARLFEAEKLFDEIVPELVLLGLKHAEQLNREG